MKKKLFMTACMLTILFVNAKPNAFFTDDGELRGKITEKGTGKPMPFASIAIVREDKIITGTSADENGEYKIKPLSPGSYSIKATYAGCQPLTINQVIIESNNITFLDIVLISDNTLPPVQITWTAPLIGKDGTATMTSIPTYVIKNMPLRSIQDIVATAPGVIQKDSGRELYFRGSRSNATQYIVDGIKMSGRFSLPMSAIAEINVITGGIPAQFGDATGGIVVITTKSFAGR
jgi:carboxypeptidase family protein/TonB-dependent receptor-like protein